MAISREKQRAHRKKTLEAAKASSSKLVEPMAVDSESSSIKIPQKIKVSVKTKTARSALVQGEGRSMTMDIDWVRGPGTEVLYLSVVLYRYIAYTLVVPKEKENYVKVVYARRSLAVLVFGIVLKSKIWIQSVVKTK